MKIRMTCQKLRNSLLVVSLLLMFSASASSARIYVLSADEWAQPRSGAVVAEFESLRAAVKYRDKINDGLILVRYPGEDSGELWAAELRDWLISLGVPSDTIRLVSGNQAADEIRLLVGERNQLEQ